MTSVRSVITVLSVLLLSTWGGVMASASDVAGTPVSKIDDTASNEHHSWTSISLATASTYPLREASGVIHSPFGSFDPAVDMIPLGPESLYDPSAMQRTGMILVQSNSADISALQDSLSDLDLAVIDVVPDDTLVIRVDPERVHGIIDELGKMSSVRWIGQLPIAWRVSSELVPLAGRQGIVVDLDIIPSPDL
ncbi:MAG: hypothetical protein VX182_03645, partial [Candidatus Thermoplasmatota archaeon]|nr:hypothetical protein [Candidatus Thermoplasmatota archaeon]